MALVKMSTLLANAKKNGVGCGAFGVYNMEALMGTIKAAEELNTPIILQLSEARFEAAPLNIMGPMMVNAAKEAKVDIAVHLDHGCSREAIKKALEMGFTSVMYDGSLLPFETNLANTKLIKEMADKFGADVEAELGHVGRYEGGDFDCENQCTIPEDAEIFINKTNVAALAVAIGNQHGNYTSSPKLRFDILKDIRDLIPEGCLVLHGGSGISDEEFQECIRSGIVKINIVTSILDTMVKKIDFYLKTNPRSTYYDLNREMVAGAYEVVKHHIKVFNMA